MILSLQTYFDRNDQKENKRSVLKRPFFNKNFYPLTILVKLSILGVWMNRPLKRWTLFFDDWLSKNSSIMFDTINLTTGTHLSLRYSLV